jgi:hypothetical protein
MTIREQWKTHLHVLLNKVGYTGVLELLAEIARERAAELHRVDSSLYRETIEELERMALAVDKARGAIEREGRAA